MRRSQKIYLPFKRAIGIFGSLFGIIFCIALIWWWVLPINIIATKGHPFFIQKRIGKKKRIFKMYKFRSMKVGENPEMPPYKLSKAEQAKMDTWFGPFIRKTSIDETLQLFNILKGDMAFVGPRPGAAINEEYLIECRERYTPNAYEVKPGITGYAQIKMRRKHTPAFKARWDSQYVIRMSFLFDVKLFVYTIFKLFGAVKGR